MCFLLRIKHLKVLIWKSHMLRMKWSVERQHKMAGTHMLSQSSLCSKSGILFRMNKITSTCFNLELRALNWEYTYNCSLKSLKIHCVPFRVIHKDDDITGVLAIILEWLKHSPWNRGDRFQCLLQTGEAPVQHHTLWTKVFCSPRFEFVSQHKVIRRRHYTLKLQHSFKKHSSHASPYAGSETANSSLERDFCAWVLHRIIKSQDSFGWNGP